MSKRKSMGKKIRFEVFKRDSFTCQYCGKSAPDVVLEVDHINPVKHGGLNDILNLITSCHDCNAGKSCNKLDDSSIVQKQKTQLDLLNYRREQMLMMLKWREGLQAIEDEQISIINEKIRELTCGQCMTLTGISNMRKWIKKYGFEVILDSLTQSFDQYLIWTNEDDIDAESVSKAFNYVPRIACWKLKEQQCPGITKIPYINGILKNRLYYFDSQKSKMLMEQACNKKVDIESLIKFAKVVKNWTEWRIALENYICNEK